MQNPQSIFVLSDGLNVNGSELIKGLNQHAGKGVIITGVWQEMVRILKIPGLFTMEKL